MTPKERAAMQQALEALSNLVFPVGDKRNEAIIALREALTEQDSLPDDCEWIDGAIPPEGERMRVQTNGEAWFVKNGKYYRCTAEYKPEPIVIRTTAQITYGEGTKYAATFYADGADK